MTAKKITARQLDVSIEGLSDTDIDDNNALQDGDALTWNDGLQKWENRPVAGGGKMPWAYTGQGHIIVDGYASSPMNQNIPNLSTGFMQYHPFYAYSTYASQTATGYGDKHAPGSPPEAGEPIVWVQLLDPYSPFNDTVGFDLVNTYDGGEWQITIELVLDPTYIGFDSANYNDPYGSSSKKHVNVNFQLWYGEPPVTFANNSPRDPNYTLSATQMVLQKNATFNPYGDDLSDYYPKFVASGQFWLNGSDKYYITWNSLDIPTGTGTAPNGQNYSTVAGFRVSMHRVYEGSLAS